MGYSFYDLAGLPRQYDIVWCLYPRREDKFAPGPVARPALVLDVRVNAEEKKAALIQVVGRPFRLLQISLKARLTTEHIMNYVLCMFYTEGNMIRAVVEEAAALVSIALFIGMIAIWAGVLSSGL